MARPPFVTMLAELVAHKVRRKDDSGSCARDEISQCGNVLTFNQGDVNGPAIN